MRQDQAILSTTDRVIIGGPKQIIFDDFKRISFVYDQEALDEKILYLDWTPRSTQINYKYIDPDTHQTVTGFVTFAQLRSVCQVNSSILPTDEDIPAPSPGLPGNSDGGTDFHASTNDAEDIVGEKLGLLASFVAAWILLKKQTLNVHDYQADSRHTDVQSPSDFCYVTPCFYAKKWRTGEGVEMTWLGQGNYNAVFTAKYPGEDKPTRVAQLKKISIHNLEDHSRVLTLADDPAREKRLLMEIHPDVFTDKNTRVITVRINGDVYAGLEMPFIPGQATALRKLPSLLLDIYLRTGRIVIDGIARGNFLTYKTAQGKEKTILIDVTFAVKLAAKCQAAEQEAMASSQTSIDVWDSMRSVYVEFFKDCIKKSDDYVPAIEMIKALVVLQALGIRSFSAEKLTDGVISYLGQNFNCLSGVTQLSMSGAGGYLDAQRYCFKMLNLPGGCTFFNRTGYAKQFPSIEEAHGPQLT